MNIEDLSNLIDGDVVEDVLDKRVLNFEEEREEITLRPKLLNDFIGQDSLKENMKIYIESAKKRETALDHVLLYGPPGLGKTTLSNIIANEMGTHIKITSGPAIEKAGDLAAILTNLSEGDVLFIDEIHRMPKAVEEILYPALEDFCLDIILGKGPSARSIRIDLPKFTLVAATTRVGLLSTPLRDRFGIIHRLELYGPEELQVIVSRSAEILGLNISKEAAIEVATRSRGTPRIANRLLKRVADFATVISNGNIDIDIAKMSLLKLEIDENGLDSTDIKILTTIVKQYAGGPVGLDTLAATIGEETDTIEDVYEPYLMQKGFISRTPRGRVATNKTYEYLGLTYGNNT